MAADRGGRRGGLWHVPHSVALVDDDRNILTSVSMALEAEGLYGELGIDLAIDVHDQPWIIEVNTKPSKQTDMTSAPQTVRPSAKAIIEYCLTLMEEKE